jgi:hypothetical protein
MVQNLSKRGHMKSSVLKSIAFTVLMAVGGSAFAQTSAAKAKETDEPKGFSEIESIQGTVSSGERLFKLDSDLGWDFNTHFGVSAGVPVYFIQVPSSTTTIGTTTTTTPSSSNNGIGNAHLGFAFRAPNPKLDYASALTLGAPTGSSKKGLSSGRGTVDWDNRFEHSFGRLTPFFDAGMGNTVPDSKLFTRPYTSLGFVSHLEEGAGFDLVGHFSVGGSAYEILPVGNQKIFSRLVAKGGTAKGSGKHGRVFETAAVTSGSDLTRENGFNALVGFDPTPLCRLEVGYTRSMTFDLSSFAFNLQLNVGKLLRSKKSS